MGDSVLEDENIKKAEEIKNKANEYFKGKIIKVIIQPAELTDLT